MLVHRLADAVHPELCSPCFIQGIDAVHENGEDRKYLHRLAGDRRISPWHDIPLRPIGAGASEDLFVFICEIPKGSVTADLVDC